MSPDGALTADEAVALGRRLIAAVEASLMETDQKDLLGLLELRFEREAALELLALAERRALAMRRPERWPGTHLHARWLQVD